MICQIIFTLKNSTAFHAFHRYMESEFPGVCEIKVRTNICRLCKNKTESTDIIKCRPGSGY